MSPVVPEARPAVQQDYRFAVPAPHVVQTYPVGPGTVSMTPLRVLWVAI